MISIDSFIFTMNFRRNSLYDLGTITLLSGSSPAAAHGKGRPAGKHFPTQSQHCHKKLETEFGVPLFKPNGRGVELTSQGKAFLPYADSILLQAQQAKNR